MIVSILLALLILSLLVFVHELGHFVVARRAGVTVEEFGFGLPPRVWGVKRGGVLYSINALPLGGFVRLKGESWDAKALGLKITGAFVQAPFKSKVKILLAGVAMNALVGYLILVFLTMTGLPPIPEFSPSQKGATYAKPPQVMVLGVNPGSAAEKAGIQKGDILLAGNNDTFSKPEHLKDFTAREAGKTVKLVIERAGQVEVKTIQLNKGNEKGGQLGVVPFETYLIKYSPVRALVVSGEIFIKVAWATVVGFVGVLASIPKLLFAVFGASQADPNAVGPIGITAILSNILFLGFRFILLVVVSITISLAVINALPIPALDGGRLLLVTLDRITKREFHFFKKIETAAHSLGFVFLILLIILISILDVRRFF